MGDRHKRDFNVGLFFILHLQFASKGISDFFPAFTKGYVLHFQRLQSMEQAFNFVCRN